ncbi:9-cis-epoxycarotenoid dioxygenase NCED1 protein [Thalictrum thalictroides]|uniref:9-cis-epoxycarotenoid dioxygenase NCED1 protein n=1 Tax=Thalictrum thalictroides TaxID=46969 RepID=A0A7J6XCL5_THATH|nr:9-cis-epoxycarotenoid dioxygenase NCED1 protein [Thalictrum thalictroides]
MDQCMSLRLLTNAFHHPKCILKPPSRHNSSFKFNVSSSLTNHDDRCQQDLEVSSFKVLKKSRPISTKIFEALDDIIRKYIDPPMHPSIDPKHVLSNNFAPVDELPPTKCIIIEGTLPSCLDGAYIRNGPNPQYFPQGSHHLLEGDGMLHCIHISNGHATLCSRYVKTYRHNIEFEAGSPVFPKFFSGFNGLLTMVTRGFLSATRVVCGQFNPMNGIGLANTSLALFGDKLFALGEPDLPYQIHLTLNGDVETVGRHNFEGKFSSMSNITAHPKTDAQTGETFAFQYSPMPPFLIYFRFDSNGSKHPDVPIYSMRRPAYIHDFAITKKYAIFNNPVNLIVGGGSVVRVDPKKVPKIGMLPRYANDESEMRWFDVPGLNIMHAINAWDEEDSIVLIAPNILSVEHTLERIELLRTSLEKVRVDLKSGTVTRSTISIKNLELGVINSAFLGRKNKFGYAGIGNPFPKISGVVKVDWSLEEGREIGCRMFGSGCYGGEPFFVPKRNDPTNIEEEDDGYLVTYVHDESSGESRFLVMDAKSPTLEIVAAVKLPRRVPYGFHGLFVRDSDLRKQ